MRCFRHGLKNEINKLKEEDSWVDDIIVPENVDLRITLHDYIQTKMELFEVQYNNITHTKFNRKKCRN